jgi:predicted metal-dependent phosphoesterase TrpH
MNPGPRRLETKIDCHVHGRHSPDATGTLRQALKAAQARGLNGFAVTDHNTIKGHKEIKDLQAPGVLIIPGIELSTIEGHCLGLGVREEVPKGLPLMEAIRAIEAAGGVAVPSHPRRRVHGIGTKAARSTAELLKALEVYNAHDGDRISHRAEMLAINLGKGGTGGSDAHTPEDVGYAYTTFPGTVETVDEAVDLIAKGRTWGEGIPFGLRHHLAKNLKSFGLWVGRGFRSI